MSHTRWKSLRERQLIEGYTDPADIVEARREIRLSMALAQAVYDRRTELGLTRTELGERAGLTQAKISRIEGSDTVPPCLYSRNSPTPSTPPSTSPSVPTTPKSASPATTSTQPK